MGSYSAIELQGEGAIITEDIDSTTTFKVTKTAGSQILYITFDVIGGKSTTISSLNKTTFTDKDTNGVKIHPAYSATNFAYNFPRGGVDTGDVTFATDMPTIPGSTLRARCSGFGPDVGTLLTVGGGFSMPVAMPVALGFGP